MSVLVGTEGVERVNPNLYSLGRHRDVEGTWNIPLNRGIFYVNPRQDCRYTDLICVYKDLSMPPTNCRGREDPVSGTGFPTSIRRGLMTYMVPIYVDGLFS
jgi:hypothetical protein